MAPLKITFPLLAQGGGQGEVCETSKHHPPEVPPCPRGDDIFICRGAAQRHGELPCN